MPSMLSRLRASAPVERSSWQDLFQFNGQTHALAGAGVPRNGGGEAASGFAGFARATSGGWSTVGAAVDARAMLMSQLRFQWEGVAEANAGRRFGTAALTLFEDAPGGVPMSQLLYRLEQDVSFSGNGYLWADGEGNLRRLRPDWVDILFTGDGIDAEVAGYSFHEQGRNSGRGAVLLNASEVCHFAPEPDPQLRVVGRSWITSLVRDIVTDQVAGDHVSQFFTNAATPSMIVTAPPGITQEQFRAWVTAMDQANAGARNSGKTMYVVNGVDATPVGAKLAELDMKSVQGGVENRVAVRSRVPAVVLGVREAMQGSALNSGNYGQTRRLWADSWFTPYAQRLSDHLMLLVVPASRPAGGVRLTFDPTRIQLLQEDLQDAAVIAQTQASAIETLHRAGFAMDAAVTAVTSGDMRRLVGNHTGMSSVQLVKAGDVPSGDRMQVEYDDSGRIVGLS